MKELKVIYESFQNTIASYSGYQTTDSGIFNFYKLNKYQTFSGFGEVSDPHNRVNYI